MKTTVPVSQTGTAAVITAGDAESITIMTVGIRIAAADAGMETGEDASGPRKTAAGAGMISGRNRDLSKDPLCSTRIPTAAATSRKITTVTEKMCGKPHIFLSVGNGLRGMPVCIFGGAREPFSAPGHLISKSRQSTCKTGTGGETYP